MKVFTRNQSRAKRGGKKIGNLAAARK